MANWHQVRLLKQSVTKWEQWRHEHPDIQPTLNGATLGGVNLHGADLSGSNLNLYWNISAGRPEYEEGRKVTIHLLLPKNFLLKDILHSLTYTLSNSRGCV